MKYFKQDIHFTTLDTSDSNLILSTVKDLIEKVFTPALDNYDDFGQCTRSDVIDFKHKMAMFIEYLGSKS